MENYQNKGWLEVFGQPHMIDFYHSQTAILCKAFFFFLNLIEVSNISNIFYLFFIYSVGIYWEPTMCQCVFLMEIKW